MGQLRVLQGGKCTPPANYDGSAASSGVALGRRRWASPWRVGLCGDVDVRTMSPAEIEARILPLAAWAQGPGHGIWLSRSHGSVEPPGLAHHRAGGISGRAQRRPPTGSVAQPPENRCFAGLGAPGRRFVQSPCYVHGNVQAHRLGAGTQQRGAVVAVSPSTDFHNFTSTRKAEWAAMCGAAWRVARSGPGRPRER